MSSEQEEKLKKLSIKLRVTLWFTSFMVVLVVMMLAFLIFMGRNLEKASYKSKLMDAVQNNITGSLIEKKENANKGNDKGNSSKDSDDKDGNSDDSATFTGYKDGIWLSLYDANGNFTDGEIPDGFQASSNTFQDDTVYFVKNGSNKWYVYEQLLEGKHGDSSNNLWVRAVISDNSDFSAEHIIMTVAVYILPIVVLIIALGGYYIISRAFRPVKSIIAAADNIGDGKDLSRRIHLGEGKDEIHVLANTFDGMFDRLEAFFENEKRFTSDASHELRTPTSVIISQCEYAMEHVKTMEEAQATFEKIHDQARKMSFLISQLLTLARADKGSQKLNMEEINISELIEMVLEQMQELAQEKQITISCKLQSGIIVCGDETMLMRMLINLVENGIHYGRSNGHIQVLMSQKDNKVSICVQDDGIGIAPEHISKIWERFYQVDPSRSSLSNNSSSGLGLSMVKWIVEAHRGSISVTSEYGRGTAFVVEIPQTLNNMENKKR